MVFNSYTFLLGFLPIAIIIYFVSNKFLNKSISKIVLIIASFIFISYAGTYNVIILLLSICINIILNAILSDCKKEIWRKRIVVCDIVFNIAFLCTFKYGSTFFSMLGRNDLTLLMPLGVSFYTFQQISYGVENYKFNFHKKYSLCDYLLSVTFFPKFLQGPIVYHDELIPQFQNEEKNRFSFTNFSQGIYGLTIGLAKKVLIADNFAKIVDYGYGHISSLNSLEAILTIIAYSFQLYFDFSGYCDMASGIAKMFNIDLPINFNSPYKARNISDFWKRWHMTLTRFLTKYVYIPLGGNKKGTWYTCFNIMIVFIVSGLWHGTGFQFVCWGLMHGFASILYRLFKEKYDRLPDLIQWSMTFTYVSVAWVVFRAPNMNDAIALLKQVFIGGGSLMINAELTETLLQPMMISALSRLVPFVWLIILFMVITILVCLFMKNSNEQVADFSPKWSNLIFTYIVLCLSIVSISGVSTFLYVNF